MVQAARTMVTMTSHLISGDTGYFRLSKGDRRSTSSMSALVSPWEVSTPGARCCLVEGFVLLGAALAMEHTSSLPSSPKSSSPTVRP